jgi:hypothetical protein
MKCLRLLRYAWAAPATAVGLALAASACLFGARAAVVDGVVEVAGGRLALAVQRVAGARRFGAITFGHVVLGIDLACLDALRVHERVHVRQYERWGVLLLVLYPASSLWALLRGRDPYLDNRFERDACEAQAMLQRTPLTTE